jgi:hypothetical protein
MDLGYCCDKKLMKGLRDRKGFMEGEEKGEYYAAASTGSKASK